MNKHRKTQIKLDELNVRGGELLFEQLILRANTTLSTMMILFLSSLSLFSGPYFLPYFPIPIFRSLLSTLIPLAHPL